jgi:citrate synthase
MYCELPVRTGGYMSDLQAALAILGGRWGLKQLIDLDDRGARDDLARLSAATLSIVAQSARGDGPAAVPEHEVMAGKTAAERFLLAWRGEVDERHAKAIDTYWICTAEHGLNASTFTARIVASTGADCSATLASAVGALSGPLHGGAPARVLPMLDAVAAGGDADKWVRDALARRERIMGFGHRVYRAEDPRSRLLRRTAKELGSPRVEVAEALEQAAHEAIAERHPDHSYTNVEFWSAVVLDVADVPPSLAPAMFACSRTAGWSAHALEQKRLNRLVRPSARYVGPGERSLSQFG